MKRFNSIKAAVFGLAVLGVDRAEAGLELTADAPGVQSTQYTGTNITTENFNSIAAGKYTSLTTAVGTFTTPGGLAIDSANQYGGAGGSGNYFAVGAESSTTTTTLMLNGPESYFGMWWSAADPLNSMEILSNGVVLATFTSASALDALGPDYNGNPNSDFSGQDSSEKFAYLNFLATGNTTFNEIIFNNQSTGSGFEADNFSVSNSPGQQGGSQTQLPGLTPAPPALVMTSIGMAFSLAIARFRRRRAGRSIEADDAVEARPTTQLGLE